MSKPSVTVGALILNLEGKILLLRTNKWNVDYIIPCGHVEFGERLIDAVKREVREETGLDAIDIIFLNFNELILSEKFHDKDRHFVSHNFICKVRSSEVKLNHESDEFVWVYPKEALNLDIDPLTKASIEKYLKARI